VGYQRGCKPAVPEKAGCLNWADFDTIQKTIDEIKSKCRWCILVSHGGEEFTSLPSPYTRDRYLKYLEMGADIIVCHHPHVPMNYERIGEKIIFYSLGNFIFDTNYKRAQFNTEKGIVLQLHFTEDRWSFTAHGLKIDRTNEHICKAELPKIFVDVQEDEYNKLIPLACKMFIAATKRQQVFLYPDKYKNATEADWEENLMNPRRSGRVIGEGLDFHIICPIAAEADKGAWKDSKLEDVKQFILEQM
jgi:poly-gamma-glutamate synthesis protein (capsule biosynthesis protein)